MVHSTANECARFQNLSAMLRRSAARHGPKACIISGTAHWSYAEFDASVDALARGLAARAIGRADRVAVLARNSGSFMVLRFALARLGAIFVPINFMLIGEEVRYILEHSEARILFVDPGTAALGRAAAPAGIENIYSLSSEAGALAPDLESWESLLQRNGPKPEETARADDLLQIIYTSGTESRPKGAMLTHAAVLWQYQSCAIDCEWDARTLALHSLPLFHCAQLDAMLGPALQMGATNIITAAPTPENLLPLVEQHRITSLFCPPTIWIALLRSPLFDRHDLTSLKKGYYGASIMPVEILKELQERLPRLRLWNLYGQTEIAPVATILFPDEQLTRAGSAGRAALHVMTRVVDEAMYDVAVGEVGEVVHRSPQLMTGYLKDPERTADAFAGGWFHSGDLATIDTDGYITIVDRKKDMIKSGGENISSREVEEAIYRHPSVAEVAVIGTPDPRWIEAVTAFVVLKDGAALDAPSLVEHCREHLAGFKIPKNVRFVETLPRNASGKLLKKELREIA